MKCNPHSTLAINPGTRYLGLAVFHGNQLIDWRVKVLKGRWSKLKLEKVVSIVDAVIDRYRPEALAIKKLHPARSSGNLDTLVGRVEKLALRNGIRLRQYSIEQIEAFLCGNKRRNKRNLAEAVAANYPDLYGELNAEYPELLDPEKKRKNPYHIRMFEAVALGAMCVNEFGNH